MPALVALIDHRDRSAGRFGLELRVAQQIAQASERLLQIHAAGHRIERAELGEHAVKFFERLVLDAAQRAIARPAGRLPQRVKAFSAQPLAGALPSPRTTAFTSRAATCSSRSQSVSAAQRSISNQFQRSRCSSRSRRSASARCDSLAVPADDERRAQQSCPHRCSCTRAPRAAARAAPRRPSDTPTSAPAQRRRRESATYRSASGARPGTKTSSNTRRTSSRRDGRSDEDHADVARPGQHLIARPLRGEVELGSRVVGCDDRDVGATRARRPRCRRPAPAHASARAAASSPAASRRSRRNAMRSGGISCRLVRPVRESRFVDRIERGAAPLELTAPRVQRLRLGRVERLQAVERDQIVMQPAPAAGGKPCCIRRIEKIARRAAARDDVIPENSRLRRRQNARARSRRRPDARASTCY